jgi:hypothetical protein
VIDHASIEERRVLIQMLFVQVWVQDRAVRAIHPKPMFGTLWLAAREFEAAQARCGLGDQAPFPALN